MADLIVKYRIPEAGVKPLADAILASEPGEEDEDGTPLPETDEATIDRSVIGHLQFIDHRYRRRKLSADLDAALVTKEP